MSALNPPSAPPCAPPRASRGALRDATTPEAACQAWEAPSARQRRPAAAAAAPLNVQSTNASRALSTATLCAAAAAALQRQGGMHQPCKAATTWYRTLTARARLAKLHSCAPAASTYGQQLPASRYLPLPRSSLIGIISQHLNICLQTTPSNQPLRGPPAPGARSPPPTTRTAC